MNPFGTKNEHGPAPTIDRYDHRGPGHGDPGGFELYPTGEWCKYEDVRKLLKPEELFDLKPVDTMDKDKRYLAVDEIGWIIVEHREGFGWTEPSTGENSLYIKGWVLELPPIEVEG